MGNGLSHMFPPAPTFTESSVSDLTGKVYIITGASGGMGKELANLLYGLNATVYIFARSSSKTEAAIKWMTLNHPSSRGTLQYIPLDLNDLSSIKPSVQDFLAKETRLDGLFNNAGVMNPPEGTLTAQGFDAQLGVNCIGPFLLTKLLTPLLLKTAATVPKGSVRVVWVSSEAAELAAPHGGIEMHNLAYEKSKANGERYAISKAGNILQAMEYETRYRDRGIESIALAPGTVHTDLGRTASLPLRLLLRLTGYPPVNGAYTQLFAGFAPEVLERKENEWVVPFGRVLSLRKDLVEAGRRLEDGGSGVAKEFWEWCEEKVRDYV